MARLAGATSRIYIDEFNFSGRTNNAEVAVDVNLPPVTCFADTADEFVEGKYGNDISINGFFDPADDNYDEQMWAILNDETDHNIGIYPGTEAPYSAIGYEFISRVMGEARPIALAGAILLNCEMRGSQPIVRSTVLCNGAVTATGAVTNSNQNWGTTDANERFVAVIRVLSVSGSGTIIVDIEESSDDGVGDAYALITGMQQTFTAVGVSRETTIAATEAWKRVNVTTFSGFTSVTLLVAIGKEQGVS